MAYKMDAYTKQRLAGTTNEIIVNGEKLSVHVTTEGKFIINGLSHADWKVQANPQTIKDLLKLNERWQECKQQGINPKPKRKPLTSNPFQFLIYKP